MFNEVTDNISSNDSDSSSEEDEFKPILNIPFTDEQYTNNVKDMVGLLKKECLNPKRGEPINTACLDHLTIKKQRKYQRCNGKFVFLCVHNRCGFFDPKFCTARSMKCCHKNFDFGNAQWNTTSMLRSCFMRTVDGQMGDMDRPALAFKWNQAVTFTKGMSYLTID